MNVKDSIDMLRFPDAEKAQDITGPDLAASETAEGWTKEKEEASEFESTYAEDEDEARDDLREHAGRRRHRTRLDEEKQREGEREDGKQKVFHKVRHKQTPLHERKSPVSGIFRSGPEKNGGFIG